MKRISLLFILLLVVTLFGCQNPKTETTEATTAELTFDQIWAGVKNNYQNASSILVEENANLKFTVEGQSFEYEIISSVESTKDPLVHKLNMVMDYDGVGRFELKSYMLKKDNKFYMYSTALNGNSYTKNEITETEMNENLENDILKLAVTVKPENITNTNKYTTDGVNYIEYTNEINLSQLSSTYRSIFEIEITEFFGSYDYNLIKAIPIEEKILINLDELTLINVTYNTTKIMQECMDNYEELSEVQITELTGNHEIKFSKYNEATIDTSALK